MQKTKKRMKPRISINKLGEYLVSSPAKRKSILINQKKPKTFIVNWYGEAIDEILSSMTTDVDLENHLIEKAEELYSRAGSDNEINRYQTNAQAIESFIDTADRLGLDGLKFKKGKKSNGKIKIAGVDISVRPDLYILNTNGTSKEPVGAIKFHISKGFSHTEESGLFVATLLYHYLNITSQNTKFATRYCYCVDVFQKTVTPAKKYHKKMLKDIEAACEEINLRWSDL